MPMHCYVHKHIKCSARQSPVNWNESSAAWTSVKHLRRLWRTWREGSRTWWAKCDGWKISPASTHPADRKYDSLPVPLTSPPAAVLALSLIHGLMFCGSMETFNPYEELWFLAPRQRALIHNCECARVYTCAIVPSVLLSENQVLNALWLGFKLIPCFLSKATFCLIEPDRKDRILPLHCTCSVFI